MSADPEYGYLALSRDYGGIVTFPDGRKEFFGEHAKAVSTWQKWVEENALGEAQRKAQNERQAFIESCQIQEERLKQSGLLTPDRILKRVLDGDGNYLGEAAGEGGFETIVEKAALAKFPEPHREGVAAEAGGQVTQQVVWAVGLYLNETCEQLPAIWNWKFGFPIEDALKILNDLAGKGWRIVSVSEDRGLYKGATNQTDSAVTTVRYLLARDS
jgi:hypothetical protein